MVPSMSSALQPASKLINVQDGNANMGEDSIRQTTENIVAEGEDQQGETEQQHKQRLIDEMASMDTDDIEITAYDGQVSAMKKDADTWVNFYDKVVTYNGAARSMQQWVDGLRLMQLGLPPPKKDKAER